MVSGGCLVLIISRPSSKETAHTGLQVKQDVARVFSTGWFEQVVPDAVDTRDGVKLVIKVEKL